MTGHICPQCGTDSRPDGGTGARPACACGQPTAEQYRTAERHRAERSAADKAEMAAAEDFDPLRIRPYVTLGNDTVPAAADADERPEQRGSHRPPEGAATTMPLLPGPAAGPLERIGFLGQLFVS
ncbi:hypothetical protein ACIA74_03090 [Streptomyces sp. NPDC051658]|uniref:hypothetical protein n=1 Tax=Streptomyces sp. NPDC051658 TaxID=3365667 RepID=UPI00379E75E5